MSDLTVKQGDTLRQQLHVTLAGVDADLTGVTLTFHLRNMRNGADTFDQGLTIEDALAGLAELHMAPAATMVLIPGGYYEYEVEMGDTTGDISTPIEGKFFVRRDRG